MMGLAAGIGPIVGGVLVAIAGHRAWRVAGALYPLVMLLIIVATGNHFLVDAALGGLVVVAGWLAARKLVAPTTASVPRLGLADCPQT